MTSLPAKGDLIAQTAAIMEQYEQWCREPEAQAMLGALWGDAINDCGVFVHAQEEILFDKDGCRAEVSIGSAHDHYAFGCHFSYPLGGCGHAPSVCGELFASRDAARSAGIRELLNSIPRQLYPHEETYRTRLDKARQALEGLLAQPSLF